MTEADGRQSQQHITATAGVAYGAVDGQLHVHGLPQHLLLFGEWPFSPEPPVPSTEHPAAETLHRWLDRPEKLAGRWLYGPPGSGKSMTAAGLAARSRAEGWRVVRPASTAAPPELTNGPVPGRLLAIVDDAESQPLTQLTWLLSNALLHQEPEMRHQRSGLTRILLIGQTMDAWPAVRAALAGLGAWTDAQPIAPSRGGKPERGQ